MKWWIVFAGGGVGSMLRYAVGLWVQSRSASAFPWGTFAVNMIGCLLIGVIATLADERAWITPPVRLLLVTGLLGGFTTFSSFGMETWQLVANGRPGLAFAYAAASLVLGLLAVAIGVQVTRQLV